MQEPLFALQSPLQTCACGCNKLVSINRKGKPNQFVRGHFIRKPRNFLSKRSNRLARDPGSFTEAQLRQMEAKRKYDAERYRRLSTHTQRGTIDMTKKWATLALKRRKTPGHAALTRLISNYKWNAIVKRLPFELSREEFSALVTSDCHYCGQPPAQIKQGKDIWSPLLYNGVDRVDNTKGYVQGNVVPCCKQCNAAKRNLTVEEFLDWVKRIWERQEKRR